MNIQIKVIKEKDVTSEQDLQIKKLLCQCFPKDITVFSKTRYWNNITPKFSVVLYDCSEIIAQLATIDRVIKISEKDYSVAGISNVCVNPNYQGKGLSKKILLHAIDWVKKDYDIGLLFCKFKLKELYNKLGWLPVENENLIIQSEKGVESKLLLGKTNEILMYYPLAIKELPEGTINFKGINW